MILLLLMMISLFPNFLLKYFYVNMHKMNYVKKSWVDIIDEYFTSKKNIRWVVNYYY
jgi:hypothetical protein